MYLHVLSTWFFANVVHPFMFLIVFGWEGGDFKDLFSFGMQVFLYSFIFSLPALFLAMLAIYGIFKMPMSNNGRFLTWLAIAPVIVLLNYWLLFFAFSGLDMSKEDLGFMMPAILAVILTILVRFSSFFKTAIELNKEKDQKDLKK